VSKNCTAPVRVQPFRSDKSVTGLVFGVWCGVLQRGNDVPGAASNRAGEAQRSADAQTGPQGLTPGAAGVGRNWPAASRRKRGVYVAAVRPLRLPGWGAAPFGKCSLARSAGIGASRSEGRLLPEAKTLTAWEVVRVERKVEEQSFSTGTRARVSKNAPP
jgi:hypothetical protein